MNAYYHGTNRTVIVTDTKPLDINIGDKLISFICAIISALTCDVAIVIEKISLSVAFFVAFFGVVGSVEGGSISMLTGILVCFALSVGECLILKSLIKKKKVQK